MVTHSKGLPIVRPGHLVDDELAEDVSTILGYYQTHGWISAKVEKPQVTDGSSPGRLVVTIPIQEGPRAIVARSGSRGPSSRRRRDPEEPPRQARAPSTTPTRCARTSITCRPEYHNHGWREASVKDDVRVTGEGSRAEIAYRVEEGQRTFFGKTIVRGNTRTNSDRVTRARRPGRRGARSRRRTSSRRSATSPARGSSDAWSCARSRPTRRRRRATSRSSCRRGGPSLSSTASGYQYAPDAQENQQRPVRVAGISYNNLFGRMQSAGLETQYAPLSGRCRLQLSFREPYPLQPQYPLTSSSSHARADPGDRRPPARDRRRVSQYYGKYLRLAMRSEYQRIRPSTRRTSRTSRRRTSRVFDQPIEEATIGPNMLL